jgi:hypothetical protein
MQTLRAIFILSLAGATTFASAEQITCESHQDGVEACTTLLAGSHVRLVKQLSETRCVEGQNWGIDTQRNSLWISKGCRAVFDIEPPHHEASEAERPSSD